MRVTCTLDTLSRGLSQVGHAISSRNTLPILSNVLLIAEGTRLTLTGSNRETTIVVRLEATVQEPGTTTIPAKLLTEYVANLPHLPISITVPTGTCQARIDCGRFNATFIGMDPTEFTLQPSVLDGELPLMLDAALLKELIEQTCFAAAGDDEGRPILTGVHLEVDADEQFHAAAADSFRLALRTIPVPEEHRPPLLVPARALKELGHLLPNEGAVQIQTTANRHQILFKTERLDLSCQLLEGVFPNFWGIIPQEYAVRAVVKTRELTEAIKAILPFARANDKKVLLKVDQPTNSLIFETTVADIGTNVSPVSASMEGECQQMQMWLNATYLEDVLSVLDDVPEVAMEMTAPNRPLLIKPAMGPTRYKHVIMPLFGNNAGAPAPTPQATTVAEPVAASRS